MSQEPQPRADLIEEAAEWLAALDAGSVSSAAFEAWRGADVRHAVAFAQVAGAWRDLDMLRTASGELASSRYSAASVPVTSAPPPSRRHLLRVAASIATVVAIGGGVASRSYARETARTKVGERRTVAAAPGLTLDLNTDTCVHWRSDRTIRLWLEQGEVAIRLTDGKTAELRTPAGNFTLATGRFNARLRGGSCELTAIAGTLADERGGHLSRGQIALAARDRLGTPLKSDADLARVTAWQRDTLMLSGEGLDYALAEMNRYLPNKIVIGDPALSRLRLGGTFSTNDPREFLTALHTSFGVHASTSEDGGIVLTRA